MERSEVLEKFEEICRDVFENEDIVVKESDTAADIEGWDSLTHLSLINELEETFDIAFRLDEITGSTNVGELLTAIMKHMDEK